MEESKSFFKSKTFLGVAATLLSIALRFKGIEFESEDKALLVENIQLLIECGGVLFAMYGRVVAKTKLVIKK